MQVGIPKEILTNERRVAAVPDTVSKMVKSGMLVAVEAGAGAGSFINDREFETAGATIAKSAQAVLSTADIVLKVNKPTVGEIDSLKEGAILIGLLQPLANRDMVKRLAN